MKYSNIMNDIIKEAQRLGFAKTYFAKSTVLLVYAYAPFKAGERISAYYLASDRSYRAAKALCSYLRERGYNAEMSRALLKPLFEREGLGKRGKNSLLYIEGLGSRIILHAINTNAFALEAEQKQLQPSPCPEGCKACMRACPVGAIDAFGYHREKCMRNYMDKADYPDWVREKQQTFMGCEICMQACPLNAKLALSEPDESAKAAFDLKKLASGDTGDARALVGRNITGNGKLTAEALTFLSRDRLDPETLAAAELSPFEAVRTVAKKLTDGHLHVTKNI